MWYDLAYTHTHTEEPISQVPEAPFTLAKNALLASVLAFEDNANRRRPGHITFTGSVDSEEARGPGEKPHWHWRTCKLHTEALNHTKVSHYTGEKNFEGRTEGETPCWSLKPFRLSALSALLPRNQATAPRQRRGEKHRKEQVRGFVAKPC